ncbi:MAG: hypothetical protein JNN33_07435 [Rhodospirillaceae bacterium]|jgi:hypothetical protein|nr:hypothetical protein [Rhodospirillaceae bacterium]
MISGLLALAPAAWNPAWRCGEAIRAALGEGARIAVDPRRVIGKLAAGEMAPLKTHFLVPGLAGRQLTPIRELHTYRDVEDFAAHGDDYAATRLFRWLQQAAAEGRPINARGVTCDSEDKMLDYYRTYLDLFRRLQRDGYRYTGPDEICFGIGAGSEVVHMRRGTHRLASAHFLGLPSVTGYVTHADPAWVAACRVRHGGGPVAAIAAALRALSVVP